MIHTDGTPTIACAGKPGPDYRITNHGSITLLEPLTGSCEEWIEEHVGNDDTLTWGRAIVVEPRYLPEILVALEAEGFEAAA